MKDNRTLNEVAIEFGISEATKEDWEKLFPKVFPVSPKDADKEFFKLMASVRNAMEENGEEGGPTTAGSGNKTMILRGFSAKKKPFADYVNDALRKMNWKESGGWWTHSGSEVKVSKAPSSQGFELRLVEKE